MLLNKDLIENVNKARESDDRQYTIHQTTCAYYNVGTENHKKKKYNKVTTTTNWFILVKKCCLYWSHDTKLI